MASGKGNTFINDYLKLVFNAVAIANIADNAATSPLTNLYVGLHTGTLSASSAQNTTECDYGGYGRVAVSRSTAGWVAASAQTTSNVAAVTFGSHTSGSNDTATDVSIGTASSGVGKVLYWGALNSSLLISSGITPQFAIGALDVNET